VARLELATALSSNIRLRGKCLTVKNTLAYFGTRFDFDRKLYNSTGADVTTLLTAVSNAFL
jgi:hypothetical protein